MKNKDTRLTSILLAVFVIATVAMMAINAKYKQYRQDKVNNNPLSSQKIVFEKFGANDISISNATYDQLIERIDTIMARNKHFSKKDVQKIVKCQLLDNSSKSKLEESLGKTKIDSLLRDMDTIDNGDNLVKVHSTSKLKKGKKIVISIDLPSKIIKKYRIDTTPRTITVSKIINDNNLLVK